MNDAAEVLDTLYTSLEAAAGKHAPVNAVFSLNIVERVKCHSCDKITHQQDYNPVCSFDITRSSHPHSACRTYIEVGVRWMPGPARTWIHTSICGSVLQCFFTTSTTELRETAASSGITELGTLLKEVIATEKTCDTDEGEALPVPLESVAWAAKWLLPSTFFECRIVHTP